MLQVLLILATALLITKSYCQDEIHFPGSNRSARILLPHFYNTYKADYVFGRNPTVQEEETFDFIVVGSGSAGAVIANRLSEVPQWKVLLLEVGEEATPITDIPVIAPLFQFTQYNWNYLMEKQDNCALGFKDQRMAWPRGRALGGSTIINYMIHIRGNPGDYDRWASLGNPEWSYKKVLPYFIKSEDANIQIQDAGYHNQGGYLSVSDVPFRSESVHAYIKACQEAGHPYVDYNGKDQMGVSYVQATLRRGKRCSVEKGFLRPIQNRSNLKVLTKARVVKILIDSTTNTANGVQYVKDRQYHIAKASKEVIISAGAFNSPQLLMLSGIGPASHLQELGIPVLQNLPVGQKLYDHLTFIGLAWTLNASIVNEQRSLYDPKSFLELVLNGQGPLTTLGGVEAITYFKTNVSTEPDNYPDMELIFVGGSLATDKGEFYRKTFRLTDEIYNTVFRPVQDQPIMQILPMLIHPKSYGYLKLKSKNPYHWPKFYGNFFTDPQNEDIKTFIAAIRESQRIISMPAFQKYGPTLITEKIPGCQLHEFNSDGYWECALRHVATTLHHQISTCKMGPSGDPEAVVDGSLRVYGIKNLRVADTSIIPIPLAAHTNVPAVMVGEKAADLIKREWLKGGDYQIDIRRNAIYFR